MNAAPRIISAHTRWRPMRHRLITLSRTMLSKFGVASTMVALGRLAFILFVVIAGRTVDPTGFGLFMIVLVSTQILALICTLGTGPSAQVTVSDAVARQRPALILGFIRFAVAITASVSLGVAAILTATSLVLRELGWIEGGKDVLIPIAMLLFPMAMSTLRETVARALGSNLLAFTPRDVIWTFLMSLLLLATPAVAVSLTMWAALTLLLVEAAAWLIVWQRYLRPIARRQRTVVSYYARWLRHSIAMLFNFIVGFSFGRIDMFAISAFTTLAVAGFYAAASRVAMIVAISERFVIPVVLPAIVAALSRRDMPRLRSEIRHGLLISLLLALPVYGAIILCAEPIMAIFGEPFRAYGNVLRILATAQLGLAINGPLAAALTGAASPLVYARFSWIALTVTAVLLLVLTPLFGALGAACAIMLGIGLQVVMVFGSVNRRFHVMRR